MLSLFLWCIFFQLKRANLWMFFIVCLYLYCHWRSNYLALVRDWISNTNVYISLYTGIWVKISFSWGLKKVQWYGLVLIIIYFCILVTAPTTNSRLPPARGGTFKLASNAQTRPPQPAPITKQSGNPDKVLQKL